jgi:1,4-alpha-glucan branching enzyme
MAKLFKKTGSTQQAKTEFKSGQQGAAVASIGIKKEFVKRKNLCKVTFRLPELAVAQANSVSVVGDFNNWNIHAHPMKKLRNGDFTATVELKPGNQYQFRYLIDGSRWENDWNADKYVRNPFGDSDNSVVIV